MEISIQSESERFQNFLQEKNNNNIIFSGIYGIGKSYFINDFFNNQYSDEYIPIILTPVNYSVANNEDIFEYIKADILLQLLEKVPCDFSNIQITSSVATYFYINNNLDVLIGNILSTAEKVCFKTDIIHQLLELRKNFKNFQKENSVSEDAEVKSFMEKLSQKQGSIYESNIITQIIQKLISNAKGENKKEVILIIDDLDRIDPEHIFRILNILSAHDDFCRTNEHKFKFDKTILVCDIENIRKIFHAKYGADVDFSGYIDKFYSKEIFYFNNEYEIAKCVANQVLRIKVDADWLNINNFANSCFVFILQNLIKFGQINIRTLEKLPFYYNISSRKISEKNRTFYVLSSPSMTIFELLRQILGTESKLSSALLSLSNKKMYINTYDRPEGFFDVFIALADYPKNKLTEINTYSYRGIEYKLNESNNTIAQINYSTIDYLNVDYFKTLYDAYSNYRLYFT